MQAHDALVRIRPSLNASLKQWHAFYERSVAAMGLGRGWARLVERRRERKRARHRNRRMRSRRVRMTWQTCRQCGSGSFLSARGDRVCGGCGCLSLH